MNEKKVIVVIVEGLSDESALGGIFKEYFSSEEIQFAVVHGDITSNEFTLVDNVVSKVEQVIDRVRRKYGYHWEDFIKIIHITDTDGVFTNGCVVQAEVDSIQYYEDHMEALNVQMAERRNKHKAEILFKLYSTGKIHKIKYCLYFNSCNLEHVLYNQLKDFSDDEKEEMSDEFAEKYEGRVEEFIDFISDSKLAVPGTYKTTWKFIEKNKHSLERHTNMNLIFKVTNN